jgi:hypothetical protein
VSSGVGRRRRRRPEALCRARARAVIEESMTTTLLASVAHLSNAELLAQVTRLAAREREATAALVAHLAELDARRLYLAEGCSSLFTYCTQVLHLSEHAAYGRIEAARVARRYPLVLERLAEGAVTLTTVALLAPHLTLENHRELLEEARHQSKREVEALVARLRPQPPVPASVRKLPISRPSTAPPAAPAETAASGAPLAGTEPGGAALALFAPAPPPPPVRPAVVAPLAPERYRVQFTASAETYAKLRLAQDLLRHQIPDGDLGQVLDRALTALVGELTRKQFGATARPRRSRGRARETRYIPSEVRRAVRRRDGGRCAFVSREGRRCTERAFLEFHHVLPYAAGGKATVDNIQLRCRAHNQYEAERDFGPRPPWTVREPARAYGLRGRAARPPVTRPGPSGAPGRATSGRGATGG